MPRILSLLLAATFSAAGLASARAQVAIDASAVGVQMAIKADKSEYSADLKVVTLRGNVHIQRGVESLRADMITYNQDTKDAQATGNVVFENGKETWRGDSLAYNFDTRVGDFGLVQLDQEPFHVTAARSLQLGPDHFRMEDVTITTCDADNIEAWVDASSADVFERRVVKARNAVFYLHGIPLLYLPSYTLDLDREPTHFDFLPGYSNRNGPYALTAYTIPFGESDQYKSVTHVDYRAERGAAFGQDFRWRDMPERKWDGFVTGYFAQDDKPYRNAAEEERKRKQFIDKDEERYRLRLNHSQNFGDGESLYVESGYLSDPEVVQDFFDEEFRRFPEQENRVSFAHSDSHFTAGLELNHQFNSDFYDSVNRQPEAFLNINRLKLGDSGLYYQSQNSASVLERTFSERSRANGNEDYDTQRLHSTHTLFYPTKQFGWLNLTPRAGAAGTYYGDTLESVTRQVVKTSVASNGVITVSTNNVTEVVSRGADFRPMFELGLESSFKAFRVLHDDPLTNDGIGLRHVVEPYIDYTFVPEPDLLPANLYQFDSIDRLERRNDILFGVRNKIQTRKQHAQGTEVIDLLDFNLYTAYLLDPDEDDESLSDVFADIDIRINDHVSARFDSRYDTQESEVSQFNSRLSMRAEDASYVAVDHRYRPDTRNLLQLSYGLFPRDRFSIDGLTRYDFETSEMEEQQIMFNWTRSCVGYGIGGKWIAGDFTDEATADDDWQVWAQLWLTAFPRSRLDLGR